MGNCLKQKQATRGDRYKQPDPVLETKQEPGKKKEFSWDKKRKNFNREDYEFKDQDGMFLWKVPGSLKGQMFKL